MQSQLGVPIFRFGALHSVHELWAALEQYLHYILSHSLQVCDSRYYDVLQYVQLSAMLEHA